MDLPTGTADAGYLTALEEALAAALAAGPFDIAFYLAGADPWEGDRLGRLCLTKPGLRRRDALVLDTLRGAGLPVCVVLAGGYAPDLTDTVDINSATATEVAARVVEPAGIEPATSALPKADRGLAGANRQPQDSAQTVKDEGTMQSDTAQDVSESAILGALRVTEGDGVMATADLARACGEKSPTDPSGTFRRALPRLVEAEKVEKVKRGHYRITAAGRDAAGLPL